MTGAGAGRARARRGVVLAAGLSAAALAGGCSSSPGPVPGRVPAGSGGSVAAAVATAARINLAASDLPAGWRGRRHVATATGSGAAASLAACLHAPGPRAGQDADVSSASYSRGQYRAGSEVVLSASSTRAAAGFRALAGPGAPHCIATVLSRAIAAYLPAGASVVGTSVDHLVTPAPTGVRSAGYRITMTVAAMGHQLSVYSDISLLNRGRVGVMLSAIGIGNPFPPVLRAAIDRRVESRLLALAAV